MSCRRQSATTSVRVMFETPRWAGKSWPWQVQGKRNPFFHINIEKKKKKNRLILQKVIQHAIFPSSSQSRWMGCLSLLEQSDYPQSCHSSQGFPNKYKSAVVSYLLDFLVQHPEELLLALRGVDAPACRRGSTAGQRRREKTLLCSFGTAETHSIFPLEPASSEGGSWPRKALFSCRIKSTFHFLITEKPTKTCSECSIKDARETHCAVRAVHSSLIGAEVLDFLHSFHPVLICDRGRGAHLLMHGEQRTSLSGQPSRPHSSEQGWC